MVDAIPCLVPCSTIMERSQISLQISNCQFWPLTAIALGWSQHLHEPLWLSALMGALISPRCVFCQRSLSSFLPGECYFHVLEWSGKHGNVFWQCFWWALILRSDVAVAKVRIWPSLRLNLSININTACSYSAFLIYLVSTLLRIN